MQSYTNKQSYLYKMYDVYFLMRLPREDSTFMINLKDVVCGAVDLCCITQWVVSVMSPTLVDLNECRISIVQCWQVCLFQALMVWDVSVSPAVLSKSLPHSHKDWITSCVWTPDCVVNLYYVTCCKGMQLARVAELLAMESNHCTVMRSSSSSLLCSRLARQTMGGCVYGICRRANVSKKSPGRVLLHLSAVWWADYTSIYQRKYSLCYFLPSWKTFMQLIDVIVE